MRRLPLGLVERIFRLPFMRRPRFLAQVAPESPSLEELVPQLIVIEIRGGYLKWAHLSCPKCGEHIQLPLAGKARWSVKVDLLRRPSIAPSIWEMESCGAHFFIEKGELLWCEYSSSDENATLSGRDPSQGIWFCVIAVSNSFAEGSDPRRRRRWMDGTWHEQFVQDSRHLPDIEPNDLATKERPYQAYRAIIRNQ